VEAGDRAVALFVVQREDCSAFSACYDLDPSFSNALDRAAVAGVEMLVYQCDITVEAIALRNRMPLTSKVGEHE